MVWGADKSLGELNDSIFYQTLDKLEKDELLNVLKFIYEEQLKTETKSGEFIKREKIVDYMCKLKNERK